MKKLLLGAIMASSAPAFASPSTFTLSGWTADAGKPETFTINRAGVGGQVVTFATKDDTAKAGTDYAPTAVTIRFGTYQKTAPVSVPTMVNNAALGQLLHFNATIVIKGLVVSSAGGNIIEPPAPTPAPTPTPVVLTSGMAVTITQVCPAMNRPETSVVGDQYMLTEMGSGGDWAVLSNSTHPGDGYFALYLPTSCFAPVTP